MWTDVSTKDCSILNQINLVLLGVDAALREYDVVKGAF